MDSLKNKRFTKLKMGGGSMYRLNKLCVTLILVSLFFMFGCAAKKITTVSMPVRTKLSNYNVLKIEQFYYDSAVEIKSQEKADKLRDMFQERVKYDIYNLNLFEKVGSIESFKDTDRILSLKGKITYMKRVTKAARLMLGAMAGRARVDVDIQLLDSQTGDILGEASIKGTSTGGTIFAGRTEEAFHNASKQVAEFIKNSY